MRGSYQVIEISPDDCCDWQVGSWEMKSQPNKVKIFPVQNIYQSKSSVRNIKQSLDIFGIPGNKTS